MIVNIIDINDLYPVFDKPLYETVILEEDHNGLPTKIIQVSGESLVAWLAKAGATLAA